MPPLLWLSIILLDITCMVHARSRGKPDYWFYLILFTFGVGAIAYILLEILPEWIRGAQGQRARLAVSAKLDPEKHYRALKDRVADEPSVRAMTALAAECLRLKKYDEAAALYQKCLSGIHSDDPDLLLGMAEADLGRQQPAAAKAVLDQLQAQHPGFRSAQGHLLYARTEEDLGNIEAAKREYLAVMEYFPGPEAACRYAMLLERTGEKAQAKALYQDLQQKMRRAPVHVRRIHADWWALVNNEGRSAAATKPASDLSPDP